MNSGLQDRKYWLDVLDKIVRPVLSALSERQLKQSMPIEGKIDDRGHYTYLEALGRSLVGISPWLELGITEGEEGKLRTELAELAKRAIDAATDPDSPDYMNFSYGYQPIVDTAFLAHAILRAPTELWDKLEIEVKRNLVKALKATRTRKPHFNNWLLFSAMIEAALLHMGEEWDPMRIDYALKQHEQWYLGDGMYGDGPQFHWDYYNSFVIQPMLVDIIEAVADQSDDWAAMKEPIIKRAQRYAVVQERLISPEGTFPPIGRSLPYRFGAFQSLGQTALRHELDEAILPAQVRCALTAVIHRMIEAPGTFDSNGWLKTGFCGYQPNIGEQYISTGSLYLCTAGLLPLGLSVDDAFWKDDFQDWTSRKIWLGQDMVNDHALYL